MKPPQVPAQAPYERGEKIQAHWCGAWLAAVYVAVVSETASLTEQHDVMILSPTAGLRRLRAEDIRRPR